MRGHFDQWSMLVERLARENRRVLDRGDLPPPNEPADEDDVADVQRHLGIAFAPDYIDFLAHANGWPDFYLGIDLFGTKDFWTGRHKLFMVDEVIESVRVQGVQPHDALVVAASEHAMFLIVHISKKSPKLPGWFIQWDSAEVEGLSDNFEHLLRSLIGGLTRIDE